MTVSQRLVSPSPAKKRKPRRNPVRKPDESWIVLEISLKLVFNSVLSVVAITTLIKLLPYQATQQQKIKEVQVEVQNTENRVNELRDHLNRNFDPLESRRIMQEQSSMIDPDQRRIVFLPTEPSNLITQKKSSSNPRLAAKVE